MVRRSETNVHRFMTIPVSSDEIGISMTDGDYNTTYSGPRHLKTSAFEAHDYGTDHYQETISSKAAVNTYVHEIGYFLQDALYNQNGVKLLSSGIITNRNGETALLLELENTSDNMVYLSTSDISINGLGVNSSIWSCDAINPDKRCIVNVDLSTVLTPAYCDVYTISQVGAVSLWDSTMQTVLDLQRKLPQKLFSSMRRELRSTTAAARKSS